MTSQQAGNGGLQRSASLTCHLRLVVVPILQAAATVHGSMAEAASLQLPLMGSVSGGAPEVRAHSQLHTQPAAVQLKFSGLSV
jgi:hypothetical protein